MEQFKTKKGTTIPFTKIKGKSYVDVKWRIVWFLEENPGWVIKPQAEILDGEKAVIRAEIYDDKDRLRAQARRMVTFKDFQDYLEKAETQAIGRALALLGYGTQFAMELEENGMVADSPVVAFNNTDFLYEDKPTHKAKLFQLLKERKIAEKDMIEIHRSSLGRSFNDIKKELEFGRRYN